MGKSKRPITNIDRIAVKAIYEGEFIDRATPDEILCDDALYSEFRRSYETVTKEKVDGYSLKKTLLNMRKSKKLKTQTSPK